MCQPPLDYRSARCYRWNPRPTFGYTGGGAPLHMIFLRIVWLVSLAAVIIGSLVPAQSPIIGLIDQAHLNDKVQHFGAYAVLAALPALARFRCRRLGRAMVFLVLLGAALELGQLFSPGRSCDWHDLLANVCGILAGTSLVRILQRFVSRTWMTS